MDLFSQLQHYVTLVFTSVIPFLFVLTVVVFFHELGHFLVARWNGVKITDFSIGFGKEIWGFNDKYGTRWKLAWLPLGGYVKFVDDENAASVPDADALEGLSEEEKAVTFQGKTLGQRSAIVAAGPIANFILAIVIFASILTLYGEQIMAPRIGAVKENSIAAKAGLRENDLIVRIEGSDIESFTDITRIVSTNANTRLLFEVDRDGRRLELPLTPQKRIIKDGFGNDLNIALLQIEPFISPQIGQVVPGSAADSAGFRDHDVIIQINDEKINNFNAMQRIVSSSPGKRLVFVVERDGIEKTLPVTPKTVTLSTKGGQSRTIGRLGVRSLPGALRKKYNPVSAVWKGTTNTYQIITQTLSYIGKIIVGRESADQLGGPIRIAQISSQAASVGFSQLVNLIAVLSVSIGLINLFPIPMLDGGHLLFYIFEAIKGEPLSERTREYGFRIGLALVLMLMVFTFMNDLIHIKVL